MLRRKQRLYELQKEKKENVKEGSRIWERMVREKERG